MRQQRHDRVQRQLPLLVADGLSWWRHRLVNRHLLRCDVCAAEAARQERVVDQLAHLRDGDAADADPPLELLDQLLDQAADPGLRARVAAPARGAISGARPGLSAVLVLVLLGLAAAAVWVGWRLAEDLTADD